MDRDILSAMGRRGARSLVLGLVLGVVALLGDGIAESRPLSPAVVRGAVTADGRPEVPTLGWHVHRQARGVYSVSLPGERVTLDVDGWDAVADVSVVPLGAGINQIRFTDGAGRPVDTEFDFVAIARHS